MANFTQSTFVTHDDYMTPKSAWTDIKKFLPEGKVIWEAFYGDGESGKYLKEMGFEVIHEPVDFFENDLGDLIVSNPPFSKCREVFKRLFELDKPFMVLFPCSKIATGYYREFKDKKIQLIVPKKRIPFTKLVNGEVPSNYKSHPNFDCFYYCYKMNLEQDITFLD